MKILVTGGAGFIGSNFVKYLLDEIPVEEISKIVVLDSFTYAGNRNNLIEFLGSERFELVNGDICNSEDLYLLESGFDIIFNFAAESHVDNSIKSSLPFANSNTLGTVNLLEYARTQGISKFVQVSTDEVYGSIDKGSWDEDYPLHPSSPYSASKASGDLFCKAYFLTYGLDVNVTRCSNNYGPFQHPEKLIPSFISRIVRGQKLPLYGDGNNVREWIHVIDHCRALWLIGNKGKPGSIYNIGSGFSISNIELTRRLLNHFGLSEDSIEYVKDRLGHDLRYSLNSEKLYTELKFSPSIDFDKGLLDTVVWYEENFDTWVKPLLAD